MSALRAGFAHLHNVGKRDGESKREDKAQDAGVRVPERPPNDRTAQVSPLQSEYQPTYAVRMMMTAGATPQVTASTQTYSSAVTITVRKYR
jgi:hypothetical protein